MALTSLDVDREAWKPRVDRTAGTAMLATQCKCHLGMLLIRIASGPKFTHAPGPGM